LGKLESHAVITELCRELISNGNLFAFEFGCEYLLKYDSNFIEPYIEKYAKGEFSVNEFEWFENSFYNEEYIVNIAKTFAG
jgi:hypothetical protein